MNPPTASHALAGGPAADTTDTTDTTDMAAVAATDALTAELAEVQAQLADARELLRAIREGDVEALLVQTAQGPQVFALRSAEAASSQLRRDLLAQVSDAVVAVDSTRRLIFINAAAERVYGARAAEVLGLPDTALFEPIWHDDADRAATAQALLTHGEWHGECVHRLRDGRLLAVEASVSTLHDDVGAALGTLSVIRDVSARRLAQEQLRVRNAGLAVLARASQALVLADCNDATLHAVFEDLASALGMELLLHYRLGDRPDTLALAGSSGLTPAQRQALAQLPFGELLCGRVARQRQLLVVEDLQHSLDKATQQAGLMGMRLYVGVPLMAHGELLGVASFATRGRDHLRDGELTLIRTVCDLAAAQHVRARDAQRIAEQHTHLQLALDASVSIVFEWDIVHDQVRRLHGVQPPLHGGQRVTLARTLEAVHPADRDGFLAGLQRAQQAADGLYRNEFRIVRPDGRVRWLGENGRVEFDAARRPLRLVGISMDITPRKQAEAAVRDSEERLQLAMKATRDVVWEWRAETDCMTWSEAGGALLGWTEPQTAGVPVAWWLERVHPADQPRVRAMAATVRADPALEFVEAEYRLLHRGGHPVTVIDRGVVVRDAQGRVTRIVGTLQDVTARRRAEADLRQLSERFEAALQASQVVVFNQDLALRYTWIHNPALGYAAQQVLGRRDSEIMDRAEDAQRTEAVKRQVLATGVPQRTEVLVVHQGEERFFDLSVQPQRDAAGAVIGVACAAVDITERKRADQALREDARRKDEFLAMLAHELRNPLAPIRTTVGILGAPGIDAAQMARCRDIIDRQSAQMARLLDDLLDASRLSMGKVTLQRQPVALKQVLDAAIETSQPLLDQRSQPLVVAPIDAGLMLDADAARLTQVFANLLNNASKYSHPGGHVELQVQARAEQVLVCVRDRGIGIAPELQGRVFEPFVQGDVARHPVPSGLGVGLSLARRLVELHGGSITLDSGGAGQGSQFCVLLPLLPVLPTTANGPALDAPNAPAPLPVPGRRRVLVVDDNVDAADTTAMLLQALGCEVAVAYDGAAALQAARQQRPDVVFLDLGMQEMDGYEACRRIRGEPWAAGIRLVALSGWGQADDRRRSAAAGFDLHLTKPAAPTALIEAVNGADS